MIASDFSYSFQSLTELALGAALGWRVIPLMLERIGQILLCEHTTGIVVRITVPNAAPLASRTGVVSIPKMCRDGPDSSRADIV